MALQNKTSTSLLIIFYRNPVLGKVKTRLAATIGVERALSTYLLLANYTKSITEKLLVDRALFYSEYIDEQDNWPSAVYQKQIQSGEGLGEKMFHAIQTGFHAGYKSICIIGTDCLELSGDLIEEAFYSLQANEVVIGPAKDGGYYLLGMNKLQPSLFRDKKWSTNTVFAETLSDINLLGLNFGLLKTLNDVDEEKDLPLNLR